MTSMQAPAGTSKSAKFQNANPLGPMADPFSGLDGEQSDYQKALSESIQRRMMDGGCGGTVTKGDDHHQRIQQQQQQQQQQQEMAAMIQLQHQAQNVRQAVEKQHDPRGKDDDNDGDDDRSADSDDEWLNELESDPALEEIREHRLQQLRQEQLHKMELKSKGHGDYRTISQDEFLPETCAAAAESSKSKMAASEWVVVHFFHDEFIKCKVMDHHLKIAAEMHLECKFLRIEAQKAPFFCSKLKVMTLPTVLVLRDGTVVDRMVGFEGIAEDNEWPTRLLQKWLAKSGAIEFKPPSREIEEEMERLGISVQKGSIRRGGVRHYDDDDE